jgi:F-type H+-transporting ATPase subunit c
MFVGLAMAETSGIYGLVVALILIFANPMVSDFLDVLTAAA